jgi:hypothetical protein
LAWKPVDRCDVTGLSATPDGRGVGGVRVIRRAGGGEQLVPADLVVDATGHLGGDLAAVAGATPELRRSGAILAMEGDRWIATLFGYLGDQPPVDPEGFTAFAASLATPDLFQVIRDAEPLDDARVTRYRPTCADTMNASTGSRTASWSSGMRSAASTRSPATPGSRWCGWTGATWSPRRW